MEIWKDIPGYNGDYKVSNFGDVKSLKFNKEKILKKFYDKSKYYNVKLNNKTFTIHKLLAISFLNHKPCGHNIVVDHINNIRTDNRLENLQLVTHRLNISKDKKGSSKHAGVYWHKKANKWCSEITISGNKYYLGLFTNELEAMNAYKNKLNNKEKLQ